MRLCSPTADFITSALNIMLVWGLGSRSRLSTAAAMIMLQKAIIGSRDPKIGLTAPTVDFDHAWRSVFQNRSGQLIGPRSFPILHGSRDRPYDCPGRGTMVLNKNTLPWPTEHSKSHLRRIPCSTITSIPGTNGKIDRAIDVPMPAEHTPWMPPTRLQLFRPLFPPSPTRGLSVFTGSYLSVSDCTGRLVMQGNLIDREELTTCV